MSKDPFAALPRLRGPKLLETPRPTGSSLDGLASLSKLRVKAPNEWERILSLGFDPGLEALEVDAISRLAVQPKAYLEGFRLKPHQAWAYLAVRETTSLFVPIGVGAGKTNVGLLTAAYYFEKGHRKIMFCMEPNGWFQLNNRDIPKAQQILNLGRLPFQRLGMRSPSERAQIAASNSPGCYLVPYSLLSREDGLDLLYSIQPTVIIADEAHNVQKRSSARTKRLFTYIGEAKPFFVPMSGTMAQKSIMDYHHLEVAALGARAPIPLNPSDAMEWAVVLDSGSEPSMHGISKLMPLMHWAQQQDQEKYGYSEDIQSSYRKLRMCYQLRFRSAPGVVSTDPNESIGTSLVIANRPAENESCAGWEELARLINQVESAWLTPNGDEIKHAIHTYLWLRELSCGFWYKLDWPQVGAQDRDRLEKSKLYLDATNAYNRTMRMWLEHSAKPHLDTPLLVELSMKNHGAHEVGEKLFEAWRFKHSCDFPGRIERLKTPVRVCSYKIDQAVAWARQQPHGIIWYEYQECGLWLMDALRAAGINALHCPAGRKFDREIDASKGKMVVASIDGHGTGKNLQFHTNQFFFQFPRRAKKAEQVLGRLHRLGQEADELIAYTNNTTEHDHMCFNAMLIDSLFVMQNQGERRKVIFATYDPLPQLFPPEVLMERGFQDIKPLSEAGRRELQSLFG